MSDDFQELAEKTVVELFDMVKDKVAEIHNLKAQLNNMEQCYIQIKKINDEQSAIIQGHFEKRIELQKRVDACQALIGQWNAITFEKTTHWSEGYEEGCYHCSAQLEEILRGDNQ